MNDNNCGKAACFSRPDIEIDKSPRARGNRGLQHPVRSFLPAIFVLIAVCSTLPAFGQPLRVDGRYGPIHQSDTPNASTPVLYLVGGPSLSGKFQDALGNPDSQGWVSVDRSVEVGPAVGNFGRLLSNLANADNCPGNSSPQWVFIDDGTVVPGTGGAFCVSNCYGPGGYVVNSVGGLAGPTGHLWNEIWSPQIPLPGGSYNAAALAFDMYLHQELGSTAPGLFAVWHVRSTDNTDPSVAADWTQWRDRDKVYYGGPDYVRFEEIVTDLLKPGATYIQIAIGVHELGSLWGINGTDSTPGPYFDNFELRAYQVDGPTISMCESNMAQDAMPAQGFLDFADLWTNHVPFLRALDSQAVRATVVPAAGQAFSAEYPQLAYTMDANPVFDAFRTLPTTGIVIGVATGNPDEFEFPLPATGFAFPGDRVHYLIEAQDASGATTLPADPAALGFGDFTGLYSTPFVFRALPSVHDDGLGGFELVPILHLKDSPSGVGEAEWFTSFQNLGYVEGKDYDVYATNIPSADLNNGIAASANLNLLSTYDSILYTSADLDYFTITPTDASLLWSWTTWPNRYFFATGNHLVSDMVNNGGSVPAGFVSTTFRVALNGPDIAAFVGGPTALTAEVTDPSWSLFGVDWIVNGACGSPHPGDQRFDAVTAMNPAIRSAEFHPLGLAAQSAVTRFVMTSTNEIITLPYGLMYVQNPPIWPLKSAAPLAARTRILEGVLMQFGHLGSSVPAGVNELPVTFSVPVSTYPNPFNPSLTIAFAPQKPGPVRLTIHDLQGRKVRTLVDGNLPAGPRKMIWDGADDAGKLVASGVYFYRLETAVGSKRGKIMMIK